MGWNRSFPVTEQRLADQARQIRANKWVTDIEIEEIRTKLERSNSKVEVQKNDQQIIKHSKKKQSQSEEQGAQKILVEYENKKQQKTCHISSFPKDDKILVKKAEIESYNEKEKELLIRVV